MHRAFLLPRKEGAPIVPILYPNLGAPELPPSRLWFEGVFSHYTQPCLEIVADPSLADCIVLPHKPGVFSRDDIRYAEELAERHAIPILVFSYGDSTRVPQIRHSIVFKSSQYRDEMPDNVIITPGRAEDLGRETKIE